MTISEIDDPIRLRLEVESRPESVTLVRSVLSALAEELDLEDELADDLRTAVSEACNNVVLHAYPGAVGPMVVSIDSLDGVLEVSIEDRGAGITHIAVSEERMGVGLAVISALADRAQFEKGREAGTTVRMSFDRRAPPQRSALVDQPDRPPPPGSVPGDIRLSGAVVAWLSPVALLPSILGRLLRAVAANSKFTLAAVADMYAVCEAISAYAKDAAQLETVGFAIDASPGRLELTTGPFVQPAFHASDASGALWGALEDAVDAVDSVFGAGYELLRITVLDHHRDRPTSG